MSHKIIPANSVLLRRQVIELLQQNNLPVSDLDSSKQLFGLLDQEGGQLVGCGGLEFFGDAALLRSVCIKKELQGKGWGKHMSHELEQIVKLNGIHCVYLLTITAKDFFEKKGYLVIDRNEVPLCIRETTEFAGICPSSATVMKKQLRPV